MPDEKISQLDPVTDVLDADDYVLARAGTSKRITGASLKADLGGSIPFMLRASLHNSNGGNANAYNAVHIPFRISVSEAGDGYSITGCTPQIVCQIDTPGAQYLCKPLFGLVGDASSYEVPASLQALVAGWGADPVDELDIAYTGLRVLCIGGTDAGKGDIWALSDGSQHIPLSINDNTATGLNMTEKLFGDLGTTFDAGHCHVVNAGTYFASLAATPDFFYP